MKTLEQIRARCIVDELGCWLWQGSNQKGYGVYSGQRVHRLAYELAKGLIPSHLQVDHLCRVRLCANPDHLEAVTSQENIRRGAGVAGVLHVPKTECKRGHLYVEHGYKQTNGSMACRPCNYQRRHTAVYREQNASYQREYQRRLRTRQIREVWGK